MSIRLLVLVFAVAVVGCKSSNSDDKSAEERGFGESTNPMVPARIQARVDNIRYQRGTTLITNLERLVAYGEQAVPTCVEGLKSDDAMTRMGCAYVLGRIGDTRTVPDLEGALKDPVDYVRYEAASQLGNMGSKSGYGVLVEGLESDRVEYRFKCFEALRDLTGNTFGYVHNAPDEERAEAVAKWKTWLDQLNSENM
ncbi:MAG TPA: HEAT repeat domain-containing protein [Planctomycetota bacterium]|nr:HEAT repeat domain-containing protein [Planctomycetota bacterium]